MSKLSQILEQLGVVTNKTNTKVVDGNALKMYSHMND